MLIITGMGRSGTSVLAGLCKRLKFDPGGDYTEGINAGLEDPEVVSINERILGPVPQNDSVRSQTFERIESVRREVIKDPRFILAGGTALRFWWQQRQDLRVVLTIRDPGEVVRSRQAHPHWFGSIPNEETEVLRNDITSTMELMTSLGIPFRCLHFPEFLTQPEEVFEALRFGGLSFTNRRAQKQWRQLIDHSKVRHTPGWQLHAGSRQPEPIGRMTMTLGLLKKLAGRVTGRVDRSPPQS